MAATEIAHSGVEEGRAREDVPRVVGMVTSGCSEKATALLGGYARTVRRVSSAEAAEPTKLYENSFRVVNIAEQAASPQSSLPTEKCGSRIALEWHVPGDFYSLPVQAVDS